MSNAMDHFKPDPDPAVRTWAESLAASADQAASTSALLRRLTDEVDRIRADYNAVLLELSAARAAASWIVARDGGRHCERCEAEVTRGQAYELQDGTGGLVAHIHCPEPAQRGEDPRIQGEAIKAYAGGAR